ncbi:DoxX family protein [Paenibacillus barcinonensis]|uniref:DoxX family protein n=1 Tax=Paenibacillus barcinonensis TaxID=198119 RepID=A0A2V4W713_PAEBA|nr:DoxX family protein [Paenibacillus barcinonensis]PYE50798.1 putative membrane protein YphA (DoxX/SURF4 family) [Paenibacillus barcinonensis]QKS60159.1 DoxX family protein [Paenibacillus barcinonensis]
MNNKSVEMGLFFLRIMIGLIFVLHGWSKFEGGISGTVGFFESIGIPGFMASVVAIIELAGGAAVILGLGTRVFAALFIAVMVGAVFTAKAGQPFLNGTELDYMLMAGSLTLLLTGSRFLALDYLFNRQGNARQNVSA